MLHFFVSDKSYAFQFALEPGRAAEFVYPAAGSPRVALLLPGFRETRFVRSFAGATLEALQEFDPDVLAGTPAQLRRIAMSSSPLPLRNAVVVLTQEGDEALSQRDRDLLWEVFGVPVFEQYLSRTNEVIATECEAHDGLHAVGTITARAGWQLEYTPCACGDKRARLVPSDVRPVVHAQPAGALA